MQDDTVKKKKKEHLKFFHIWCNGRCCFYDIPDGDIAKTNLVSPHSLHTVYEVKISC